MNIVSNEALIKRNSRIAQAATFGGLAVLAGGMYVSFRMAEQFALSLAALFIGFILTQVGLYYTNRYSRRPRPDEILNQALKGLDHKYTIYHYKTPVPHLLVGPGGMWFLLPRNQRGLITFSKGRWRQKGGNMYLKLFAQESIGRPDADLALEADKLNKFLVKLMPDEEIPQTTPILVLTHPRVEINISEDETPPAETMLVKDLKDVIRKNAKSKALSPEKALHIQQLIEEK